MSPEMIEDIIKDLELLYDISRFPCYNQLGKDRKKMRKKLKKMIKKLKKKKYSKVFMPGYEVIEE